MSLAHPFCKGYISFFHYEISIFSSAKMQKICVSNFKTPGFLGIIRNFGFPRTNLESQLDLYVIVRLTYWDIRGDFKRSRNDDPAMTSLMRVWRRSEISLEGKCGFTPIKTLTHTLVMILVMMTTGMMTELAPSSPKSLCSRYGNLWLVGQCPAIVTFYKCVYFLEWRHGLIPVTNSC